MISDSSMSFLDEASIKATEDSWKLEFVGNTHSALKEHILHCKRSLDQYTPYRDLFQADGTGKSRTVDEFSKYNFVIPVNLRRPTAKGFPASDERVYNFFDPSRLINSGLDSPKDRMIAFMYALFKKCGDVVKEATMLNSQTWLRDEGATWFREKMTEGQTTRSQGAYRVKFYDDVVDHAQNILEGTARMPSQDDAPPTKKTRLFSLQEGDVVKMVESLIDCWGLPKNRPVKDPIVYLVFDEADSLTQLDTAYVDVLSSLLDLQKDTTPLQALGSVYNLLFLAALWINKASICKDGTIHLLCYRVEYYAQYRPFAPLAGTSLPRPYPLCITCYLGHNSLPELESCELLDGLVPFVARKLIKYDIANYPQLEPKHELACLSTRFPIEFISSPSTTAEQDQVADHMRICMSVDGTEFLQYITISPSEPILSEGAYLFMNNSEKTFNAPKALSRVLREFAVH
ncbi:hypothetical protein BDP27DRAFT_1519622 [Rhodocollybia butyracea]|uniref:Uncharacterized protein n=1 Tax=Rhodocollybia butyracea TaxID=206335 RepID=A0A9P5PT31_9AGAR|nr:hypothetical protein BDP27DRAFT_1519622 [Rhodocollybia butyracea]